MFLPLFWKSSFSSINEFHNYAEIQSLIARFLPHSQAEKIYGVTDGRKYSISAQIGRI